MRYVVIVREPLPEDLNQAAISLTEGFDLPTERAQRLLARAPGPLTRPVPERDARNVAAVLRSAGLVVEVREGSVDGPVMEWILPDLADRRAKGLTTPYGGQPDPALTLAGAQAEPAVPRPETTRDGAPASAGFAPATDTASPAAWGATDDNSAPKAPSGRQGPAEPLTAPALDPRKTHVPGMTVTTPPRDPARTTLVREPPKLERGGLRRRIATAATLPAFLTLLVTLLALVVTLLPIMRNAEVRRAASTANAVAATLEGLSSGLPLTAPLVRAQVAQVAERTAARLPAEGVDFLVVLDAERAPLVAWYRGQVGLENMPAELLTVLEERAAAPAPAEPVTGVVDTLRRTGNDLLALAGLTREEPIVATAGVRRAGADEGLVLAGSEGRLQRGDVGWALLTALLVGLIPVLFGVLAALSLSRGVRDAILYLLRATDRISHGDLEREVELKRDDELGQIARAVERMRVSLLEAMERLRRR